MPTLGELLDQQAGLLHAALADRVYTDGFERQLAENLIAAIPAAKRGEVLEHMLEWDHLMPRVMAVDCLLDETDDRSYEAVLLRTGIGRVRLAVRIGTWTVRGRPGLQIGSGWMCGAHCLPSHQRSTCWPPGSSYHPGGGPAGGPSAGGPAL
jgi:hypothetical protein